MTCDWTDPHTPGGAQCNLPVDHPSRYHQDWRNGKVWAEWSGGRSPFVEGGAAYEVQSGMTPGRLAEIRGRTEQGLPGRVFEERRELLAEVDRLATSVEAMDAACTSWLDSTVDFMRAIRAARA